MSPVFLDSHYIGRHGKSHMEAWHQKGRILSPCKLSLLTSSGSYCATYILAERQEPYRVLTLKILSVAIMTHATDSELRSARGLACFSCGCSEYVEVTLGSY